MVDARWSMAADGRPASLCKRHFHDYFTVIGKVKDD